MNGNKHKAGSSFECYQRDFVCKHSSWAVCGVMETLTGSETTEDVRLWDQRTC